MADAKDPSDSASAPASIDATHRARRRALPNELLRELCACVQPRLGLWYKYAWCNEPVKLSSTVLLASANTYEYARALFRARMEFEINNLEATCTVCNRKSGENAKRIRSRVTVCFECQEFYAHCTPEINLRCTCRRSFVFRRYVPTTAMCACVRYRKCKDLLGEEGKMRETAAEVADDQQDVEN